ncbi:MAG: four helix bundle protein [Anaerolineales bacterium]|nr:four helix bundle protein [Anaerolineales bacterium]
MATIRQFENLKVWQSARILVNLVYAQTNSSQFARDFALRDQIRRAAISVMSNIAEGFDSGYDGEFIRFLGFSFRSAAEVQSQLYTALDQQYLTQSEFDELYSRATDVRKQIRGFVSYLSNNKRSGRIIREQAVEYSADPLFTNELEVPGEFAVD